MNTRIGIDFGGVIVKNGELIGREDTSFTFNAGLEMAHPLALDAIRELVAKYDGQVWIISKAGPAMQVRTRAWLGAVDFFSFTELHPDHLHFCLKREEKAEICTNLGITHFIDDRVHIMQILRQVVPHLYLFGEENDQTHCPPWATFVSEWPEVSSLLKKGP